MHERTGRPCYCGRDACIETFLSGPALSADHEAATGERLTARELAERASDQEARALDTLGRYEMRLARALASVINVVDPHIVVLGGGLSNVERLYTEVPKLWSRWIFSDAVRTPLVRNHHGDSSGARGAALLWEQSSH
jgi:predicted NBD/HSP70 family sugar kinase